MKLPPSNPTYSWPELFARLAFNSRPSVAVEPSGRVSLTMTKNDSEQLIEALDRLTRETE